MNTTAISITTELQVKEEAKKIANELGISLSALINTWLKQFVKTKTVVFDAADEEPSDKLKRIMLQSKKDYRAGRASPAFDNIDDAIAWLHARDL